MEFLGLGPVMVRSVVALIALLGMEFLGPIMVIRVELLVGSVVVVGLGPVMGVGSVMVLGLGRPGMASRQLYSQRTSFHRHT